MIYKPSFPEVLAVSRTHGKSSKAPHQWNGVQGLWSGVQGDGKTAFDLSGYGNDGTLNGVTWVTSERGRVWDFLYANSAEIELTQPFTIPLYYTVSWWMRTNGAASGSHNGIFRSGSNSDGGYGWWVHRDSGNLWGRHNASDVVSRVDGVPVSDGIWHHIAVTWDGADARLYAEGAEFASISDSSGVAWDIFRFGRQGLEYYTGQLDLLAAHNRALSPSEIKQLYEDQYALITPRSTTIISVGDVAPPTVASWWFRRNILQTAG